MRNVSNEVVWTAAIALAMAATPLAAGAQQPPGAEPANKVAVAGSTAFRFGPGTNVTLLSETVRTASTADLLLQVTAECRIFAIQFDSPPVDFTFLYGNVRLWVEIDGRPVPVSADDVSPTPGRVPFCSRSINRQTIDNASTSEFDTLSTAAGFNWVAPDVGPGVHTIALKGELIATGTWTDLALAQIVARTLVIEPVRMARGQDVGLATP